MNAQQIEQILIEEGLRHAVNRIEDQGGEVVIWANGMGCPVTTIDAAIKIAREAAGCAALHNWRKSLGWSQARASREIGCAIRSIQNWEDGTYDAPGYILLAAAWVWTRERPYDPVPFDLP